MKTFKIDTSTFETTYFSVVQILVLLADPTFLWVEGGRGTGKTTHIMASRMDRVQNDMPGSIGLLTASTYKFILDTIIPGIMEYFYEHYERGMYFEFGKKPPSHFKPCYTHISDWRNTLSFHGGTVFQFVSIDRPESGLGKNAASLHGDEFLKIPREKFVERLIPALRSNRSKFGKSPYYGSISGYSSTPNLETDEYWWLEYEKDVNHELINAIIEIALELHYRMYDLEIAQKNFNEALTSKLKRFVERWSQRLANARRGQTYYLRASSLSNIKNLGLEYVLNQAKTTKDEGTFNTSILAVRSQKVKDKFFIKFGKEHIFQDSYKYNHIDMLDVGFKIDPTCKNLKYCNPDFPLYIGFDPGPFMSIVVAQRWTYSGKTEFRVIKNFYVIHPEQHEEIAKKFHDFFLFQRCRSLFVYYDRAANQKNPNYRQYYPVTGDDKDSDAFLLRNALVSLGWSIQLLSLGQKTIYHGSHYRLLNILFGKHDQRIDDILICRNECEELISSINHSPLKKTDGAIELDKSAEKKLPKEDQAYYSPQIATALMYLLWGEFNKYLPEGSSGFPDGAGTYVA